MAAENGKLFFLLEFYATMNCDEHIIFHVGNDDIVEMLINKNGKVGTADEYQWTPLHYAAKNGMKIFFFFISSVLFSNVLFKRKYSVLKTRSH